MFTSKRATPTVRSQKTWPSEQVHAQPVEKKTVCTHPTRSFEHGPCRECGGKDRGLIAKPADPLLAALVGHLAITDCGGRMLQRLTIKQPSLQKQPDEC